MGLLITLAQGWPCACARILSALKTKFSTYYNWRHLQPSRQESVENSKPWHFRRLEKNLKFYGYRRIAAYSQQNRRSESILVYDTPN